MSLCKQSPFRLGALLFWVGLTLLLGFVGGLIGSAESYETLVKPPLSPPGILFPIVWTVLYTLMGVSAYLVWNSGDLDRTAALRLYLIQLIVNVLWPLLFFRLEWRLFSFFWIITLILLVILMLVSFNAICKIATYLNIPYLLWLLFAAYLNLGFYLLNRPL